MRYRPAQRSRPAQKPARGRRTAPRVPGRSKAPAPRVVPVKAK